MYGIVPALAYADAGGTCDGITVPPYPGIRKDNLTTYKNIPHLNLTIPRIRITLLPLPHLSSSNSIIVFIATNIQKKPPNHPVKNLIHPIVASKSKRRQPSCSTDTKEVSCLLFTISIASFHNNRFDSLTSEVASGFCIVIVTTTSLVGWLAS